LGSKTTLFCQWNDKRKSSAWYIGCTGSGLFSAAKRSLVAGQWD